MSAQEMSAAPSREFVTRSALTAAFSDAEGLPRDRYVVRDGRVFVFEKLVSLADRIFAGTRRPTGMSRERLLALADNAWVSPREAVELWSIVPAGWEVLTARDGRSSIRHCLLNAAIPVVFTSTAQVHSALARLLAGDIIAPAHLPRCFEYEGQPLVLLESLDPSDLPPRPLMHGASDITTSVGAFLEQIEWSPGFSPLPEDQYQTIRAIERAWLVDIRSACVLARRRIGDVWIKLATLPLAHLNAAALTFGDEDVRILAHLRTQYPELGELSDTALFGWHQAFRRGASSVDTGEPMRNDEFAFYLLAKLVANTPSLVTADTQGEIMAVGLLYGRHLREARRFAADALAYDAAIRSLARRAADAITFVGGRGSLSPAAEPADYPPRHLSRLPRVPAASRTLSSATVV